MILRESVPGFSIYKDNLSKSWFDYASDVKASPDRNALLLKKKKKKC